MSEVTPSPTSSAPTLGERRPEGGVGVAPAPQGSRWPVILAGLGLLAVLAGGFYLRDVIRNARRFTFQLRLKEAEGISVGSPVRVGGIESGSVKKIAFGPGALDSDRLLPILTLAIDASIAESLRWDLTARVDTVLLFGENALSISPGSPASRPVKAGELIDLAAREKERQGVLSRARQQIQELFDSQKEGAPLSLKEAQALLAEIQQLQERVDRMERALRALQREKSQTQMP